MLRTMMVLSLAGLMSRAGLAQSNGSVPEKQPASAQPAENASKRSYLLNFVVRELEEERVINSRSYSTILRGDAAERASIRAGEKVPFSSTSGTSTQWQQVDVGVNIDCRKFEEMGDRVSLQVSAEISSLMDSHGAAAKEEDHFIVRSNRWESTVLLPIKQPTILFSSDDPASKRKMQLQLTVTLLR